MSLPGLSAANVPGTEKTELQLAPNNEWRFEVLATDRLTLKLVEGTAEIFGTELAVGQEYEFSGQNSTIFTWDGCKIQYWGKVSEYTSDNTPMPVITNLHFALDGLREQARVEGGRPPVLLVLGPSNSGKTSLCKILVSYASKLSTSPLFINLDPKQPVVLPPGCIEAVSINGILDVEEGWGHSSTTGPSLIEPKQPLGYYYGLESVHHNPKYYRHLISQLALAVAARLEHDKTGGSNGLIIDAPTAISTASDNYSTVSRVVADFGVNIIVVVGNERLYSDITKRFKDKDIATIKMPRSGGVVEVDSKFLRQLQHQAIAGYFYGTRKQVLSPYSITVKWSDIVVYKVMEVSSLGESALPSGGHEDFLADPKVATHSEYLEKVEPSSAMEHSVLAVVNASPSDPVGTVVDAEVVGYLCVSAVDEQKKLLKILSPLPGRAPNKPLILGEFKYYE